jgi:acetylglutamate kinase
MDNSIDKLAIDKASALVEALGYIQRFHNKIVVVKVGGSIIDDEKALSDLLNDIVFMNYVGLQPIVVHGGGKAINQAMETAGLQPQMVMGRRYTDERTLAIAEHVLCNQVNAFIVNFIQTQGCEAMGLHSLSSVVLFAEKTYLQGPDGRRIDLGLVGEVTNVNSRLLQLLVQADSIPCIATIARDASGNRLNVNADTAAGAVAAAMKAEKLVVISDTHGIRTNPSDPTSLVRHLTISQIDDLVKSGVITTGMLPKVEACVTALRGGVNKTHIIDGKIPHAKRASGRKS